MRQVGPQHYLKEEMTAAREAVKALDQVSAAREAVKALDQVGGSEFCQGGRQGTRPGRPIGGWGGRLRTHWGDPFVGPLRPLQEAGRSFCWQN